MFCYCSECTNVSKREEFVCLCAKCAGIKKDWMNLDLVYVRCDGCNKLTFCHAEKK